MIPVRSLLAAYVVSLAAFLCLDAVWLSQVALGLFQRQLGDVLRPQPLLAPAIAFYILYVAGVVWLAVRPALVEGDGRIAASNGAVLGLTAYATFDLTNLAVIERWTLSLAALDLAWGTVATCVAAVCGYAGGRAAMRRVARASDHARP